MKTYLIYYFLCFLTIKVYFVYGHGRLWEPIARSSAWRIDPEFPINYDDNQQFCGGFKVQWDQNGGKCGICGDSYSDPIKKHEKGGSGYLGKSVKIYNKGQAINVRVQLTANHLGWFEFRICNVDGFISDATQDCLDKTLLQDASGQTRFSVTGNVNEYNYNILLPSSLTCQHCVFQWKYHTGNSWGNDPITGVGCKGCGPQEEFYGCSDVTINDGGIIPPLPKSSTSSVSKPASSKPVTSKPASSKPVTSKPASSNPTTSKTTPSEKSNICANSNGLNPDYNSNCQNFVICLDNNVLATIPCPGGTLFDKTLNVCNFANLVKC